MKQATKGLEVLKLTLGSGFGKADVGLWKVGKSSQASDPEVCTSPPHLLPLQIPCICISSLAGGHFLGMSFSLVIRDRARSSVPGLRACLEAREARKFISLLRA